MTASLAILAHQGGWDEILLIIGPMAVIVGLLRVAKRRVDRQAAERDAELGAEPTPPTNPV